MAFLRVYAGKVLKEQYELSAERMSIGRATDNDIVLSSSGVSKHHAIVERQGSTFVLKDNKSANGVLVNGKRILEHTLNYRDEIQIFQHTLVFMPLAKLPGEAEGDEAGQGQEAPQDATVAVDISVIGDLIRQRKQKSVAQLVLSGAPSGEGRHVLDKVSFTIGRARSCDIRTRGWFAPGIAASVQQRSDGHYLIPGKRGRVQINAKPVADAVKLTDNDSLSVRELSLRFYFRPIE